MTEKIIEKNTNRSEAEIGADILGQALATGGDIIKQLLQASMSNPLIGAITGLAMANILERTKVIDHNTATAMVIVVFAATGIALTNEVLQDFTNISKVFSSGNANPNLLTPSGQVLVFGEVSNSQLNALLGKYKVKQ